MISNFRDFCGALLEAGFSVAGGGNDEGVFGLLEHGWDAQPEDSPIRWHTGDPETDPWEWRMRVLEERNDIAYGKVFFKKAGYITKEWYPYFAAVRRGSRTVEEIYADGLLSRAAKNIYDAVAENGALPLHGIKQSAGFAREDKAKFDAALTELQMKLYLTMCGREQKRSQSGEAYGWSSTVLCTAEHFWGEGLLDQVQKLDAAVSAEKITEQVLRLNPAAQAKRITRFIRG